MKLSQGGLSPKVKSVYHMEVTLYMCFAFGVYVCVLIDAYMLYTLLLAIVEMYTHTFTC